MGNVVRLLALVVEIAPLWVRTLSGAASKTDVVMTLHRGCPNDPTGREWKTSS